MSSDIWQCLLQKRQPKLHPIYVTKIITGWVTLCKLNREYRETVLQCTRWRITSPTKFYRINIQSFNFFQTVLWRIVFVKAWLLPYELIAFQERKLIIWLFVLCLHLLRLVPPSFVPQFSPNCTRRQSRDNESRMNSKIKLLINIQTNYFFSNVYLHFNWCSQLCHIPFPSGLIYTSPLGSKP